MDIKFKDLKGLGLAPGIGFKVSDGLSMMYRSQRLLSRYLAYIMTLAAMRLEVAGVAYGHG